MRNKLWTLTLAAALMAGTSGMALAQTYNSYPPPPNPGYGVGTLSAASRMVLVRRPARRSTGLAGSLVEW